MGDSACLMHGFTYASALPNGSTLGNPMHALGDSISFGRFMTESLSWEKWSTFSHKKYVEEAERYAQPGSVAQKKAFFEAHYKRIAARKAAALLEQENAAKITEAEGVGDNNAYDEKRVILNSHQDVDVKIEVVKIQEDTKKDSIVDVIEHGLIAAIGIGKEGERAVIPETEAPNEKRNSGNQLDILGNQDTVSALGSSGPPKLERPSLKLLLIPRKMKSNVPQSTTKSSVEKGCLPNSLLSLMNLVPIEVPDKEPVSATKTSEISGLACSTPLKTPLAVILTSKSESTYPTTTPLSESRRRKTTTDPLVPGSKTTVPKWHVLSAVSLQMTSKDPLFCRQKQEKISKAELWLFGKVDPSLLLQINTKVYMLVYRLKMISSASWKMMYRSTKYRYAQALHFSLFFRKNHEAY
ncbi:UNVERIFIED_CONTAM: protein WVD2-like 7 [Sesamum radiatum]|uniref:Protein WVD2-like 7 n=1 Tax=Sesamum radiatum TaxID=300843 RepID=A0AAW2P860_SESRA